MTIGVVHFRTGDDADIQADMNMAKILSRVLPYSSKISVTQILSNVKLYIPYRFHLFTKTKTEPEKTTLTLNNQTVFTATLQQYASIPLYQ